MIRKMTVENFTVFKEASFEFGALNVIHGENGTGKTHLLKLAYSVWSTLRPTTSASASNAPTKKWLEPELGRKLSAVFRPDELGRLARRRRGTSSASVAVKCRPNTLNMSFEFHTRSKKDVSITILPSDWADSAPVYFPTHEALSIFPGFVWLYENSSIPFDETWRDLCQQLNASLSRGPRPEGVGSLLEPLEKALGGELKLEQGRFYLYVDSGRMEIDLVSEGSRKLAMLAWLIVTKQLKDKGALFWDEPEANLNPRLIKLLPPVLVALAEADVQVFIATHSLFLMREIEILLRQRSRNLATRFIGLSLDDGTAIVEQGPTIEDAGDIAALDEELHQSDRYMALED